MAEHLCQVRKLGAHHPERSLKQWPPYPRLAASCLFSNIHLIVIRLRLFLDPSSNGQKPTFTFGTKLFVAVLGEKGGRPESDNSLLQRGNRRFSSHD
jgi:hypothetical protein